MRSPLSRLRARSGSALTAHRAVIHYRAATTLPAGEGLTCRNADLCLRPLMCPVRGTTSSAGRSHSFAPSPSPHWGRHRRHFVPLAWYAGFCRLARFRLRETRHRYYNFDPCGTVRFCGFAADFTAGFCRLARFRLRETRYCIYSFDPCGVHLLFGFAAFVPFAS